jgi:outer membrane lipoprotein-sorting protein
VRVKSVQLAGAILIFGALAIPIASAQRADTMMPEASAAKGKQILSDLINALGGPGYTEVRESQCEGRRALFGHNGELTGFIDFSDFRRYPDKDRTEYLAKGRNTILQSLIGVDGMDFSHGGIVITLYDGDRGWTFSRSGVSEMPATSISDFQEQTKRNIDNLLRLRLNEPGMAIRYGGSDTVDLKQADWVELTDSEGRTFRLAVDHSTHLLVRAVVSTKDEETQQIDDDVSIYSNYQLRDSVWMALQITREHNGRRNAQVFFNTCRFNPGFPDDLFSKESLQKHGSEAALKKSKAEKN